MTLCFETRDCAKATDPAQGLVTYHYKVIPPFFPVSIPPCHHVTSRSVPFPILVSFHVLPLDRTWHTTRLLPVPVCSLPLHFGPIRFDVRKSVMWSLLLFIDQPIQNLQICKTSKGYGKANIKGLWQSGRGRCELGLAIRLRLPWSPKWSGDSPDRCLDIEQWPSHRHSFDHWWSHCYCSPVHVRHMIFVSCSYCLRYSLTALLLPSHIIMNLFFWWTCNVLI